MSLVEDGIVPLVFAQLRQADVQRVVSRDTHIELSLLHLVLENIVSEFSFWVKIHRFEVRGPS